MYNGERFLQGAIDSIFNQSFIDYEFIIVDDGSEDNSFSILQNLKDERVILLRNESNLGLATSLNKAIGLSKGKYIARCDADDVSMQERIFEQWKFMEANPHIGITGTGYTIIDEKGQDGETYIYPQNEVEIKWKSLFGPVFPHPTVMIRRKILVQHSLLYNENYRTTQDYELWCRLLEFTKGINLPQSLIKYRQHRNTISEQSKENQDETRLTISAVEIMKLLPNNKILPQTAHKIDYVRMGNISKVRKIITENEILLLKDLIKAFINKNSDGSSHWKESQLFPILKSIERELFVNDWKNRSIPKALFTLQVFLMRILFWYWLKEVLNSPKLVVKYISWAIRYGI